MSVPDSRAGADVGGTSDLRDTIRRAFAEFLTIPTCLILGFLLLAVGSFVLDRTHIA